MWRVLVVNPNTSRECTAKIAKAIKAYPLPDVEVEVTQVDFGPEFIEGPYDELVAGHALCEKILKTAQDYDAFVVACYADPGLRAARQLVMKPVVGMAEASLTMAHMTGKPVAVVSPKSSSQETLARRASGYGIPADTVRCYLSGFSVGDHSKDVPGAEEALVSAARKAVDEGAKAVCLGCAGMSGAEWKIREAVGVPVFEGVACAVQLAAVYLRLGLVPGVSSSKRAESAGQ